MKICSFAILIFCSNILLAQKNIQTIVGLKLHYGTIFIHTPSVKNVSGSRPYGAEIEFSKQRSDSTAFNKCNCFARNGIALSYFNLDNRILGHGAMLSYFLEPSYKLNNKFQFNLRAAAGITYVTKPYNVIKNPENKSYTTHLNPYLQAGLGYGYNLNKNLKIVIGSSFQHFSNGAYKEPNRGVNWITGSIGVLYYSQNTTLPQYSHIPAKDVINKKTNIDAGILFVPKQGYNSKIMAQSKLIAGVIIQATKQYSRVSAFTAGIEGYYNRITKQSGDEIKWIAGIHGGHAFIFGRVIFSQQIGLHIYSSQPQADKIYFRYGLSYRLFKHIVAGINLKTHADNADFSDFRLMYRF